MDELMATLERMWRWLDDPANDEHPRWQEREAAFYSALRRYEAMCDAEGRKAA